jgi:hypothetical protein
MPTAEFANDQSLIYHAISKMVPYEAYSFEEIRLKQQEVDFGPTVTNAPFHSEPNTFGSNFQFGSQAGYYGPFGSGPTSRNPHLSVFSSNSTSNVVAIRNTGKFSFQGPQSASRRNKPRNAKPSFNQIPWVQIERSASSSFHSVTGSIGAVSGSEGFPFGTSSGTSANGGFNFVDEPRSQSFNTGPGGFIIGLSATEPPAAFSSFNEQPQPSFDEFKL